MAAPDTVLLVLTTLPDAQSARDLARQVVDSGLAACASIQAECDSVYRWQGAHEQAREVPVLLKTCAKTLPRVGGVGDEPPPLRTS